MIRSCLVLAAVVQMMLGQNSCSVLPQDLINWVVPNYCLLPHPGADLHKCCPILKLFPDEDMERCGIEKASVVQSKGQPKPKEPCKESICLMQNANMLQANQSVDYEKLRDFVDHWSSKNPEFSETIIEAKQTCARDGGPSAPPICEHDRILYCLTANVVWNCTFQDIDGCQLLKVRIDECRLFGG